MVLSHKNVVVVHKIARFVSTRRDANFMIFGGPTTNSEARLGDPEPLFCILLFIAQNITLSAIVYFNA